MLDRLGPAPSRARARLLSTIATGLYYGDDAGRVDALSAEAVTVARQVDDPSLLARRHARATADRIGLVLPVVPGPAIEP